MKKKVLHIINSMAPGGAEILLANSLSDGGLSDHTENHIAFFMEPSYLLDILDKNVVLHFMDYKGGLDIFRLISNIKKIIIDNNIDIVHSHLNPASLYTHIACPKNIPQVHTIHTTYSMDAEQSAFKLWTEKTFYLTKKNTNVIVLSDFTKNDFLNAIPFKGKCYILNNFVKDDYFEIKAKEITPQTKQLRLIAIGTLKPLKNFEYLLDVFIHLKKYNISLDIFGGGNQETYQSIIKKEGLNIRLMGHSQNLKEVINDYDLFIMPSIFEGFPLSVFEAMAAGLPLMLSNIAPLQSIVKENAIYFALDNDEKVASLLINILNNEIDIRKMALNAKNYAQKTVRREIYINKLLNIYEDVMKTNSANKIM